MSTRDNSLWEPAMRETNMGSNLPTQQFDVLAFYPRGLSTKKQAETAQTYQ